MLDNCKSAKERWGGVNTIIDNWLHNRQELLITYCDLSSISNFDEDNSEHSQKVRTLCQQLVDYVSAGHFEVYDQLMKEGKAFNDAKAIQTAEKLYENINPTTEATLDFNDKYLETDDLSSLTEDLSTLGQHLEARFESEDEMIAVLHVSHNELVA